jgi:hypothetical protein
VKNPFASRFLSIRNVYIIAGDNMHFSEDTPLDRLRERLKSNRLTWLAWRVLVIASIIDIVAWISMTLLILATPEPGRVELFIKLFPLWRVVVQALIVSIPVSLVFIAIEVAPPAGRALVRSLWQVSTGLAIRVSRRQPTHVAIAIFAVLAIMVIPVSYVTVMYMLGTIPADLFTIGVIGAILASTLVVATYILTHRTRRQPIY